MMNIHKKHIIAADFVIIAVTLIVAIGLIGYARPLVIAPIDDLVTTNGSVVFAFEKGESVLIDDNNKFTSPEKIYFEDNLIINLKPGLYYWKVDGVVDSEIRQLTIESEVDLRIKDAGEEYELVNAGNTQLNVDIYNQGVLTGNIIVDVDESANASGTKFVGRQDG